jgi:DNA-binding XRE family transcriptional regulator
MAKVNVTGYGPAACWLWTAAIGSEFGYGAFKMPERTMPAHRVSWQLFCGPIAVGLQVLHRCDVPACVNPEHLYLGTQKDNIRDAILRGRHKNPPRLVGEKANGSKLKAAQVLQIRKFLAAGALEEDLAKRFGVSRSTISAIRNNRVWKGLEVA